MSNDDTVGNGRRFIGSTMHWLAGIAILSLALTGAGHFVLVAPLFTFTAAAVALIVLSVILGEATEQLSRHVGEQLAGLLNVTLSNLAELIIVFAAIRAGEIELVQAGIVGSIIGNLLLVMGISIYVGCRKNGPLSFNPHTATLYINQLFLVAVVLMLPSLFDAHIPDARKPLLSDLLALTLLGTYIYFYHLSITDRRFQPVKAQAEKVQKVWSRKLSTLILLIAAVAAFFASECLIREVDRVAAGLGLSKTLIGFIVLPLLGNIAEHVVAVFAAYKGRTELSLAVAVGSAAQVGMVVAPCAVFFGLIAGHPVMLNFSALPLGILGISLIAAFLVLNDHEWNINEGFMLIAIYLAVTTAFAFTQ